MLLCTEKVMEYNYLRKLLTEGLSGQISDPQITDFIEIIKDASILFNEIKSQIQNHKNILISIRSEIQRTFVTYQCELQDLQDIDLSGPFSTIVNP